MERLNLDKVKIMAAAATLAMFAGTACAHLEVYGQVNKAYLQTWADRMDTGVFVDNNYSPSKLGAMGSAHLNKCVTFGGVTELEFLPNNTRLVSQRITETVNNHVVLVRKVDAWVSGGVWGKLSLGLGEAASWGITDLSYAGTHETSLGSSVANMAGGMIFNVKGADPVLTGPRIRRVFQALNGVGDIDDVTGVLSTKDRVRYDTSTWAGFMASVSYGNVTHSFVNDPLGGSDFDLDGNDLTRRSFFDAALRYHDCWGDFKVAAGVAGVWYTRDGQTSYSNPTQTGTVKGHGERAWSASIAVEHRPTGINAAVAGGEKDKILENLDNYKFWYVQLGDQFCWTSYGKTSVAIDYFQGKDAIYNGDKGKSWGLGVTQDYNKINTSLYAAVRGYKYTGAPANYDKITAAMVGVLFKFGAML